MSTSLKTSKHAKADLPDAEGANRRIDPPHAAAAEPAADADSINLLAEMNPAELQRQIEQIQLRLINQQESLDEREAKLNAHLAQVEGELRRARWLQAQSEQQGDEPTEEQRDWQTRLEEKQRDLRVRELRVQAAENRLHEEQQAWLELQNQRREELDAESAAAPADSPSVAEVSAKGEELSRRLAQVELWEEELAQLEAQLQHECELARQIREQTQRHSQEQNEQLSQEQVAWEHRRATAGKHWEERQQQLDRREQELAQRTKAIEQMQEDITRMHRESLELRLAAEQIQAELDNDLGPGEGPRTIKRLRQQISQSYEQEQQKLTAQSAEIQQAVEELQSLLAQLARQREQYGQWSRSRQQEIADDLLAVGKARQTLADERRQLDEAAGRWRHERHSVQTENRRLKAELRKRAA